MEGEKLHNMRQVLFVMKFVESIISIIAVAVHIYGFLQFEEPLPHQMFFCGTYFCYTVISIFGMIVICIGMDAAIIMEASVTAVGAVLFIAGSIVSMYYAENDFHLMYLSDSEEENHPFFRICKTQYCFIGMRFLLLWYNVGIRFRNTNIWVYLGFNDQPPELQCPLQKSYIQCPVDLISVLIGSIVSLIGGLTFMLHATFAFDALLVKPIESELNLLQVSPADRAASAPIQLVLFCKPWLKLCTCCNGKDSSA